MTGTDHQDIELSLDSPAGPFRIMVRGKVPYDFEGIVLSVKVDGVRHAMIGSLAWTGTDFAETLLDITDSLREGNEL